MSTSPFNKKFKKEWKTLNGAFHLSSGFDSSQTTFTMKDFCKGYHKNPHEKEANDAVRKWAKESGIWIENRSEGYLTMAAYILPKCTLERLILSNKVFVLDYGMGDFFQREAIAHLNDVQKEEMKAFCKVFNDLVQQSFEETDGKVFECSWQNLEHPAYVATWTNERIHPILLVAREVFQEINLVSQKDNAAKGWYEKFVRGFMEHNKSAFLDVEAESMDHIPVENYILMQRALHGMDGVHYLIEFSLKCYLDFDLICEQYGQSAVEDINKLKVLSNDIGGLSNDIFSMEKEVIGEEVKSNLVYVIYNVEEKNNRMDLHKAIKKSLSLVTRKFVEFEETLPQLKHLNSPEIEAFAEGLKLLAQASYLWQMKSPRYKYENSAFKELKGAV